MDVKSAFLYGKIEEEVYVCQLLRFEDPYFPNRVYKVEKALCGLHQAPKACFNDVKTASTPMETHKPLLKDADGKDVDEHIFQVTPKVSHLHAVKRIFRYLKGQPKLDLWCPKDSPFDLVAYTDSDYAGASLDRKSTIRGIGVNAGDSKLMLLGINLLLLEKVNAARHNLLLLVQFWAIAKVKTVNGEVRLQALVDGKKVLITETSVRRDCQLEDAEGIECLPNADIFEQLALMGYEKPSQNLTFYKAFFSPQWKFLIHTILMVKNMDSSVKFLMYPRFVQVFLDKQVGDMPTHDKNFITPSHTKKVFGNMKRVGKGFYGAVTPLFPTMMVQAQEEIGENREKTLRFLNPVLLLMIHFSVHTKTTQALKIKSLKRRVNKLEKKKRSRTPKLKRLFKIGISAQVVSSEDEGLGDQ
ncbi:uncharacterized mitochondrial protein-like protein [Tanacetum coccineum]|uniref:Uncharacterized mitochondrial protein-like protein n=1 Tax=Tanacetum coccineum TaxID=301880 RepID=A0ABQ5DMG5_9ASTR